MTTIPTDLKQIIPFIQRATELCKREPVISYFCKYYAVQLGIGQPQKSKEASAFLFGLMDDLEKDKTALNSNEAITNETVGHAYVENFALSTFAKADNQDRAGKADKITALTFLASSMFLELLHVFGDLDQQVVLDGIDVVDIQTLDKIKYARFKAADIMKALKEGRKPDSGPPELSQEPEKEHQRDESQPTSGSPHTSAPIQPLNSQKKSPEVMSQIHDETKTDSEPQEPIFPSIPDTLQDTKTSPITVIPPSLSQPKSVSKLTSVEVENAFGMDHKSITDAQRHAKFAISALQYDDVKSAVDNLEKALVLLQPFLNK